MFRCTPPGIHCLLPQSPPLARRPRAQRWRRPWPQPWARAGGGGGGPGPGLGFEHAGGGGGGPSPGSGCDELGAQAEAAPTAMCSCSDGEEKAASASWRRPWRRRTRPLGGGHGVEEPDGGHGGSELRAARAEREEEQLGQRRVLGPPAAGRKRRGVRPPATGRKREGAVDAGCGEEEKGSLFSRFSPIQRG